MANDIISLANEIATEKENIRQAINTAGVDCPADTPLKDYAGKISSIQNRIDEVGKDIFYKDTDPNVNQETTAYTVAPNFAVVGTSGLSGYAALQSITMPNVTAVLDSGFSGCKALTTINAPICKWYGANALTDTGIKGAYTNNVAQYFGNGCFQNNTNLTSISLTEALYLGCACFRGCNKVKTINIPKVKHIGAYCFKDFANNVYNDSATLQTWELSAPSVETVGMSAADTNTALAGINMPKAVNIGKYAFDYCTNLTSFNLPAVKNIDDYAFRLEYAKNHTDDLSLPSCEKVGEYAFYYRYFPKIILKDGCVLGKQCFRASNNNMLKQVIGKIGYVSNEVFRDNNGLINIDLSACTYVGDYAFYGTKLSVIDLSSCTYVGNQAFYYINSKPKVWLPSTITTIKSDAFYSDMQIYTDVANASSRPSGWSSFSGTIHYGSTYEDFLNA